MRPPFFVIYFAPALATEAAFFCLSSNKNKIIFCALPPSAPAIFLRTVLVFFARCVAMYCHSFLQGTLQSLF